MHNKRFKRTREEYWALYDKAMQDPYSIPPDIWDEVIDFLAESGAGDECGDMIYFDPRNIEEFFDSKEDYDRTIEDIKESYKVLK